MLVFEWDDEKAKANERDHGVSFEEAVEVFDDEFALEEYDVAHSEDEPRFNIIGFSSRRLLLVVYAERQEDVIRIISAWKASRKYREAYEQNRKES
jgi:hypothetical protein